MQLDGTRHKEIFIGSPNTSDIINGGRDGDNAYVVGGGTATVSADGSEVIPGGSTETDVLNLLPEATDFVNIKPSGQSAPGTVLVPRRDASGNLVRVGGRLQGQAMPARGSDDLTLSMKEACPNPASVSGGSGPVALAAPVGARSKPFGMVGSRSLSSLGKTADASTSQTASTPSFPGVPVIKGFDLSRGSDALVLSLDDFPVDTEAYPGILNPEKPSSPQLTAPKANLSGQWLDKFFRNKNNTYRPKPNTETTESPLTYFDRNGLLVLSLNRDPLGSESNPGLVIAQLLDRSGLPLKLNSPSGSQGFPTRFVIFTPSERNRTEPLPVPSSKDPLSQ